MRNNLSFLNVYERKSTKSKIVTQLLYGETFKEISKSKSWIKIINDTDNYKGYVKKKKFYNKQKNTHKVCVLSAELYSGPKIKSKIKKKLSFGSRIKVTGEENIFYKFDNLWIKKKHLKKRIYKTKNVFKNIEKFNNVRYKWGGKHFSGIDCSALVQVFLNFNNRFCPRDSKDQIAFFKRKVKLQNIKKNDLIFWKGHVAVAISKKFLIHAYGPSRKTLSMPIKKTIDRIEKTANLRVIGIRRIS